MALLEKEEEVPLKSLGEGGQLVETTETVVLTLLRGCAFFDATALATACVGAGTGVGPSAVQAHVQAKDYAALCKELDASKGELSVSFVADVHSGARHVVVLQEGVHLFRDSAAAALKGALEL